MHMQGNIIGSTQPWPRGSVIPQSEPVVSDFIPTPGVTSDWRL